MRDTVFIVVDRAGARKMTKGLPAVKRGEIPIKLNLVVDPSAFAPPVVEQSLHITDWRAGRGAIQFAVKEGTITEAEAASLKADMLLEMRETLERAGYTVTPPGDAS
jgi:hypothetical protein